MDVCTILLLIIICLIVRSLIVSVRRPPNYPPGPRFFPWLGNTIQLRREAKASGGQHNLFEKWAKQYKSNIIGLKLGEEYVVVVQSYQFVKQIHTNETYEGRPDNYFLRLRTLGTRKGITCTDGKLWYEHRTFTMKQLKYIGYGRTPMEMHIKKESESLIQFLDNLNETPIWPGSFLATSVISVLWCLTTGNRIERNDEKIKSLLALLNRRSKAFDLCGGILAQVPWLRYIAPNKTGYKLVRDLNKQLHDFIMQSINEHKLNYSPGKEGCDFIYAYIKEIDTRKDIIKDTFNYTQLTMTILDLFIAGSQTTSNTLDLALMMLAVRTDIQIKLYNELTSNLCKDEFPHLSQRNKLPYMNAFIMEVQRFFHITPITGPRRALWDTEIAGYRIPKNTTILINLKSVLMDKSHWKDPQIFRPERFIDADKCLRRDEYFIPFGQGRRRCLGDVLARSCLLSFLSLIIKHFTLTVPLNSKINFDLLPGITLSPRPYQIIFTKRV